VVIIAINKTLTKCPSGSGKMLISALLGNRKGNSLLIKVKAKRTKKEIGSRSEGKRHSHLMVFKKPVLRQFKS
jgi:hypothetical protein